MKFSRIEKIAAGSVLGAGVIIILCAGLGASIQTPPSPDPSPSATRISPFAPSFPPPSSTPRKANTSVSPTPAISSVPASNNAQENEVYYGSCAEVKANGQAPLFKGTPGYRSGLDRDKDGVACES